MKNNKHKDKILKLRSEGKTYNEIKEILGCSKATIAYHCGKGQKDKADLRRNKSRSTARGKINSAIAHFQEEKKKASIKNKSKAFCVEEKYTTPSFKYDDIIKKFGENPTCYLTGRELSWLVAGEISFDHIIPRSRGGNNSIDNLGICCRDANMSKTYLTLEEYLSLCQEVLENFGYKVQLPEN